MRRNKPIWIILIITVAALAAALSLLLRQPAGGHKEVLITVDGEEYGRYPLDTDASFIVETSWGYNTVTIRNGKADVLKADCPDRICVHTTAADAISDMIVCLPHRLVVEIVPEDTR